jgi:hypothetical protein
MSRTGIVERAPSHSDHSRPCGIRDFSGAAVCGVPLAAVTAEPCTADPPLNIKLIKRTPDNAPNMPLRRSGQAYGQPHRDHGRRLGWATEQVICRLDQGAYD